VNNLYFFLNLLAFYANNNSSDPLFCRYTNTTGPCKFNSVVQTTGLIPPLSVCTRCFVQSLLSVILDRYLRNLVFAVRNGIEYHLI
jgi:hypothetical protein